MSIFTLRYKRQNLIIPFVFLILPLRLFALDLKYASIVNTTLEDLKKRTKLSLLQGHVAINISSGNKELDAQFGEELQKAYPNFASKSDEVNREDLYQMVVKTYRENNEVVISVIVTNYRQDEIVDRNIKVKNVSKVVLETLQYKTAIAAKNEFEAYLNAAFGGAGDVVEEARITTKSPPPQKPPKEPFVTTIIGVESTINMNSIFGLGLGVSLLLGIDIMDHFLITAFAGADIIVNRGSEWPCILGGSIDYYFSGLESWVVGIGSGIADKIEWGAEFPWGRIECLPFLFVRAEIGFNGVKLYYDYLFNGSNGFRAGISFFMVEKLSK
jgi:hypothetical protein